MKSHPDIDPYRSRLTSSAFDRALLFDGLRVEELDALFRANGERPNWKAIARRGPIQASIKGDSQANLAEIKAQTQPRSLSGGVAHLASDHVGAVELDADHNFDERLLPEPMNLLFAQQWARLGLFPLHAAALRWQGHGILLLGDQGAGKSSLVLAALAHGAEVISDDWLLMGCHNSEIRAERLREFLMFRPGQTWDRFRNGFGKRSENRVEPAPDNQNSIRRIPDGRLVHCIAEDDPRYPEWTSLNRCLVLRAPNDIKSINPPEPKRPARSTLEPVNQSTLLAALIEAAMPILMTQRFSAERDRLFKQFQALASQLSARQAISGLDLIENPTTVMDRLFG